MGNLPQRTENISISLPTWLIEVLERMCFNKDFSKSCFVKKAIQHYILHQLSGPAFWEIVYNYILRKSN